MPNIQIANTGVRESVIRPTLVAVTDQVLSFLGLKEEVKDIRYITHSGDVRMPSSGLTERSNDYASFSGTNRAWVEIDDDIFKDGWAVGRPEVIDAQPLFMDRKLGVAIHPYMESNQATIKIRFNTHSYDSARQTREALASRVASLQDGIQHTVDFSIVMHEFLLYLLQDIWLKRELVAGYGDTFQEYVRDHSSTGLATVSEASGQETSLVFKRRMGRINGYFIISEIPDKPVYQEDGSLWEFSVEYRVNYDVPNKMQVRYPIMVHNQYLHRAFLQGLERQTDIRDSQQNLSLSQAAASILEFGKAEGNNLLQDMWFCIPSIDQFEPKTTPRNTATVFIALLSINTDKSIPLLNLCDLGTIDLDPNIIDYMKKVEHPFMNQLFKSFFYVHLYEDGRMREPETLVCDKDLNVFTTVDLDPRKTYRVRLCMAADILVLPIESFERLWAFPKALVNVISSINESVRHHTDFFTMHHRGKWQPWMLGPLWNILIGRTPPPQTQHYIDPETGQYLETENFNPSKDPNSGSDKDKYLDLDPKDRDSFNVPAELIGSHRSGVNGQRTVQVQSLIVYRK